MKNHKIQLNINLFQFPMESGSTVDDVIEYVRL